VKRTTVGEHDKPVIIAADANGDRASGRGLWKSTDHPTPWDISQGQGGDTGYNQHNNACEHLATANHTANHTADATATATANHTADAHDDEHRSIQWPVGV
jgi:hypothetical protein